MTDTAEQTEATAPEQATPEAKPEKPAKVVVQPHPCLCSTFEVVDPQDAEGVFAPECGLTTKSTFAQGHDARLVSFLVDGYKDGYSIRQTVNGKSTAFATPAQAVAHVSEPLRAKAEAATKNMEAKRDAKANAAKEREAKKAARKAESEKARAEKAAAKEASKGEPKATGAEVVAGSVTGDTAPLGEGQVRIKAGRWEYVADKTEDGGVTWTDGKGETQVRAEGDGYVVLEG